MRVIIVLYSLWRLCIVIVKFSRRIYGRGQVWPWKKEILKKCKKFSHSIYHLQQSFEKTLKSTYYYLIVNFENGSQEQVYRQVRIFSHDTKALMLNLLKKICDMEEKKLDEIVTRTPGLTGQQSEMVQLLRMKINGFRNSIESKLEEKHIGLGKLVTRYPDIVSSKHRFYMRNIPELIAHNE